MKIGVVSHLFPQPQHPSKGIFVLRQVEALVARGHSVTVVSPVPYIPYPVAQIFGKRSSSEIPKRDTFGEVSVYYPRFLTLPRPETLPAVSHSVRWTLRKHRELLNSVEIINAHVAVPDAFAATPVANDLNVPLVTTIHGANLQTSIHFPFVERQIEHAIDHSTNVILNSHKTQRLFEQFFGSKHQYTVIHNGVPVELANQAVRHEEDSSAFRLVSVGDLDRSKGHRYVLEAISHLSFSVEYEIIGDGPLRRKLEKYAIDLGIRESVNFVGEIPHEQVFSHLKSSDVFVLPSYREAFGVAYIEAMACGIPVIACEGEGPEDYITHRKTGVLVPKKNGSAIASVLRELNADADLRARIGSRGEIVVHNLFTWARNAEAVEKVYEKSIRNYNQ
jgi:glycosyltransferase involved in cell wall biosynthesis